MFVHLTDVLLMEAHQEYSLAYGIVAEGGMQLLLEHSYIHSQGELYVLIRIHKGYRDCPLKARVQFC